MKISAVTTAAICLLASRMNAEEARLGFPTDNTALLHGDGPGFYMYVNRDWEGVTTKPWEGGQYGMVRGPRVWDNRVVMGHWHEGVDIKPMRRDAAGEPLDEVRAIAPGRVVRTSRTSRDSNYGCYVVAEHSWEGCRYYSLYAHLRSIAASEGDSVKQGQTLGMLGYTGEGIDRERAHVHLEIGLILNEKFDDWHKINFPADPNKHGNWNGINLVGLDVARFYLEQRNNPSLTPSAFLRNQEACYAIAFKAGPRFDLIKRYPWLAGGKSAANPSAWLVKFTQGGVPMQAEPYEHTIDVPKVVYLKKENLPGTITSKGYISREGRALTLTPTGQRFISLLSGSF